MKYSFVIPCYKTSEIIFEMLEGIREQMYLMDKKDIEVILVNDATPDSGVTIQRLKKVSATYDFVKVIDLAKNVGQHNATMAGLNYASGDVIISMDDDMQTHPSQLEKLLLELEKGYDIVYGHYPEKKHSGFRNFGSWVNYMSVRILIGKPKELKTSSFWAIKKFVKDEATRYQNSYTYLQGLFLRITRNISSVPVEHFERKIGESNYSFKKLVKLWSSIIGFSIVPLRLAIYIGYLFSGIGIVGAVVILLRKLFAPAMAMGWPSLMIAICFFAGINLLFLGLVGEYVGRMFLGINKTPQYVVRRIIENGQEDV